MHITCPPMQYEVQVCKSCSTVDVKIQSLFKIPTEIDFAQEATD